MGLTFIKQTVWSEYKEDGKRTCPKALYRCDCGVKIEAFKRNVASGNTTSCGCAFRRAIKKAKITHGLSQMANGKKHPLYNIWLQMRNRCSNKNHQNYHRYGGIGIRVCADWEKSYMKFHNWCMENGWKKGKVIDKDIKSYQSGKIPKLYSPKWCSIVSQKNNSNYRYDNKKFNHILR